MNRVYTCLIKSPKRQNIFLDEYILAPVGRPWHMFPLVVLLNLQSTKPPLLPDVSQKWRASIPDLTSKTDIPSICPSEHAWKYFLASNQQQTQTLSNVVVK